MTFNIPYWLNKDTRLHRLLVDHKSISAPSDVEIASLLRQAIRESQSHVAEPSVELPLESPWGAWPDEATFASCGISIVRTIDGIHLSVQPWSPAWLACQPNQDPFEKAFQTNADLYPARRRDNPILADPAVSRFIKTYRTPGQREAVRAALGQPEGSTLTINLPTGTGKTLAIIGPALSLRGTTIVVVPTTALAIDQEKRLKEDFRRLGQTEEWHAYHGELDESVQERFREQLLEGSKRVVFTSPEALNGSLRYCVMELAKLGRLRALVIDEAHIVEEWGSSFRPDFQMLAGLRKSNSCARFYLPAPSPSRYSLFYTRCLLKTDSMMWWHQWRPVLKFHTGWLILKIILNKDLSDWKKRYVIVQSPASCMSPAARKIKTTNQFSM